MSNSLQTDHVELIAPLCELCRKIFNHWSGMPLEERQSKNLRFRFYEGVQLWKESAKSCSLCKRLFRTLNDRLEVQPDFDDSLEIIWFSITSQRSKDSWNIWLQLPSELTAAVKLEYRDKLMPSPTLERSTFSQKSLIQASQWLSNCDKNHPLCSSVKDPEMPYRLPTRLLDISEDACRLCATTDLDPNLKYVALSHCWGQAQILRLLKENYELFHMRIALTDLCKTFRDVFHVTKQLDLKYIWIDSLCIVQDDADDWAREAALMASVYGNAYVSLQATSASDGTVGLFFDRTDSLIGKQYLREPGGQIYEIMDLGSFERCVIKSRLSSRGWVFQERYLVNKTLHFTSEEIFWECRQQLASESEPDGLPEGRGTNFVYNQLQRFPLPTEDHAWLKVVQIYSKKSLTFGKDKLVALSGVARIFQHATKEVYIAGFWEKDLPFQLCWMVQHRPPSQTIQPFDFLAPSWSWAAPDYPVFWQHASFNAPSPDKSLIRILQASTTLASLDPLGGISDAFLRIEVDPPISHIGMSIIFPSFSDSPHMYNPSSIQPKIMGSLSNDYSFHISRDADPEMYAYVDIWFYIYWDDRVDYRSHINEIYFLAIYTAGKYIYGLVIIAAPARGIGCFRRIGCFNLSMSMKTDENVDYEGLLKMLTSRSDNFMPAPMAESPVSIGRKLTLVLV